MSQPTVAVSASSKQFYAGQSYGINVDNRIMINDVEGGFPLDGVHVFILDGFSAATDKLIVDGAAESVSGNVTTFTHSSIPSDITVEYDKTNGVLKALAGTSGLHRADFWQALVRKVKFSTTEVSDASITRNIQVVLGEKLALTVGGKSHYYDFIPGVQITWSDARADALSRSFYGLQGYLANITSDAENEFIKDKIRRADGKVSRGWIGGTDADNEGVWKWVDGPEDGEIFWNGNQNGSAPEGKFHAWRRGGNLAEPNNVGADEHVAHFTPEGVWNDLPDNGPPEPYRSDVDSEYYLFGYVIEYGGFSDDPVLKISDTILVEILPASQLAEDTAQEVDALQTAVIDGTLAIQGLQSQINNIELTPGAQGETGAQGPRGDQGPKGYDGHHGNDGARGATGLNGQTGAKGDRGAQGPQGDRGVQGLKGDQGNQGLKGDQGVQGETGLMGPQGDTGAVGPQGAKGDKGETGSIGAQGLMGPKGDQGIQGIQGIQGLQGDQGEVGSMGPQGLQGLMGTQGETGATGAQGPAGVAGVAGPQGIQGDKGLQGPRGERGLDGRIGVDGVQGEQGPQGLVGPKGDMGISGPQGDTGVQGIQGAKGDKGLQGIQGETGVAGIKGDMGLQGETGLKGDKGDDFNGDARLSALEGDHVTHAELSAAVGKSITDGLSTEEVDGLVAALDANLVSHEEIALRDAKILCLEHKLEKLIESINAQNFITGSTGQVSAICDPECDCDE